MARASARATHVRWPAAASRCGGLGRRQLRLGHPPLGLGPVAGRGQLRLGRRQPGELGVDPLAPPRPGPRPGVEAGQPVLQAGQVDPAPVEARAQGGQLAPGLGRRPVGAPARARTLRRTAAGPDARPPSRADVAGPAIPAGPPAPARPSAAPAVPTTGDSPAAARADRPFLGQLGLARGQLAEAGGDGDGGRLHVGQLGPQAGGVVVEGGEKGRVDAHGQVARHRSPALGDHRGQAPGALPQRLQPADHVAQPGPAQLRHPGLGRRHRLVEPASSALTAASSAISPARACTADSWRAVRTAQLPAPQEDPQGVQLGHQVAVAAGGVGLALEGLAAGARPPAAGR